MVQKIRQLTDVSHCNLQNYLSCNEHRHLGALLGLPVAAAQGSQWLSRTSSHRPAKEPANAVAPTRQPGSRLYHVGLTAGPAAAF